MSVINDALKKAKEESQKNQTPKINKLLESARAKSPKKEVHPPNKRKVILLAVLSFVIITTIVLPILYGRITKITTPQPIKNETTPPPTEVTLSPEVIALKADRLKLKAEEKAKPRQPIETAPAPSSTPSPSSDVILNGIMYSAKNPVAVINDELITEGEKIGDVKVIEIRRDSVDVEKAGSIITLSLKKN